MRVRWKPADPVAEAVPGASQHGRSFSSAGKKPRGQQDCLVFFGGKTDHTGKMESLFVKSC